MFERIFRALRAADTVTIVAITSAALVVLVVARLIAREFRRARPPIASKKAEDPPEVTLVSTIPRGADEPVPRLLPEDFDDNDGVEETLEFSESRVTFGSGLDATHADAGENAGRLSLSAAGQTDSGLQRHRNEDYYLISTDQALYTVADGMGGYAGGEIASRLAVDCVAQAIADESLAVPVNPKRPALANRLVKSIEIANGRVFAEAKRDARYTGMGTTLIAALFSPNTSRVCVAHVGDSRCYRVRAGSITLLTLDHTLSAKGVTGKVGEHLHRAIGIRPNVKVDVVIDAPQAGDRYLLCSDGLTKMLPDDAIASIVAGDSDIDRVVKKLVDSANAKGGRDNITAVLIRVDEPRGEGSYRLPSAGGRDGRASPARLSSSLRTSV